MTDKVVLITGASTGFGRNAAETLAQRGYRVFATMRDPGGRNAAASEALQSLARAKRWNLEVLEMDVTDEASVNQAVRKALDRAGRIDVVINNAGIGAQGITEELSAFGIDSVLVEPGIHRTPILEKNAAPADPDRVAEYGATAEAIARVKRVFDDASTAPDTPGPEQVVQAFVRLIETPAGQRPFRTVPTSAIQLLLEQYNAAAATIRDTIAQVFKVPELTVLRGEKV